MNTPNTPPASIGAAPQAGPFTPGPWLQAHREGNDGMFNTQVFTPDGETIATLHWYPMPTTAKGVTGTYREANARLIAAAPDLLAALESVVADHGGTKAWSADNPRAAACRAAIQRATGEQKP